jgi:hypothetical protein
MADLNDVRGGLMTGFRRLYGANPLHLIGHVAVFFVTGWAIDQIVGGGAVVNWIAWFVGAVLLHDLVLLPLYSGLDRLLGRAAAAGESTRRRLSPVNHLRVPAVVSGILLLVYFPVILGYSSANYRNDTGHSLAGYTRNWLLITAGLFVGSALIYVLRTMRRHPPSPRPAREQHDG